MASKRTLKTKTSKSQTKKKGKKQPVKRIPSDGMDVATDEDLAKFTDLLKQHNVIVVLIHADWCGHCQTFKPLWEQYKKIPGRNVPMASINERMLSKTPLKDAKLDGFPSTVVYSGKDGSFGSFKNTVGEDTHAVPNSRDKTVMTKLLRTNPSMLKRVNMMSEDESQSESAHATPEAEALLEESGKRAIKDKDVPIVNLLTSLPPNTSADTIPEGSSVRKPRRKRKRAP